MRRHLLTLCDISKEEFGALIESFGSALPRKKSEHRLKGKMIGLMFERPSTRTRLSFHRAAVILGAFPVELHSGELQLTTGEELIDTARVLPQYLDVLVMRTRSLAELQTYVSQGQMAVINALTDEEHPTQAIADIITIREALGTLNGVRVLFIGEGGNIAVSFLFACAMIPGISVTFVTPKKYPLPNGILIQASLLDNQVKERIREIHDPTSLSSAFDIIYTTRWRSMGEEKPENNWRDYFEGFQVNNELLKAVQGVQPPLIMHDMPAERDAEITAELLHSEHSLVIRQAAHKVSAAKAALCWCLGVV